MVYNNGNNVENKVIDIIEDHARLVQNGCEAYARLYDCWTSPDREEFMKHFQKIDSLEAKANSLKEEALKEISQAAPALFFRQDLMDMVRAVDQIIDLAQGSAYFLEKLNCDWKPPESIINEMKSLIEKMLRVSQILLQLIRALFQSLDKVVELSEEIDILENKSDSNYRQLIIELAHLEAPKGTALLLRESIDRLEEMVDSAQSVSSTIRNFAMSR
jgi:predicted phosphate transport protein (TIGR00153 family)